MAGYIAAMAGLDPAIRPHIQTHEWGGPTSSGRIGFYSGWDKDRPVGP